MFSFIFSLHSARQSSVRREYPQRSGLSTAPPKKSTDAMRWLRRRSRNDSFICSRNLGDSWRLASWCCARTCGKTAARGGVQRSWLPLSAGRVGRECQRFRRRSASQEAGLRSLRLQATDATYALSGGKMRNVAHQEARSAMQATRPIAGSGNPEAAAQASHMVRYQSRQSDGPPQPSGSPGSAEEIFFSALEASQTAVKLVEAGDAHPSTISIWERMSVGVVVEVQGSNTKG